MVKYMVDQLRGDAGKLQVPNVKHALTHNIGLGGSCVVTVLKRADFYKAGADIKKRYVRLLLLCPSPSKSNLLETDLYLASLRVAFNPQIRLQPWRRMPTTHRRGTSQGPLKGFQRLLARQALSQARDRAATPRTSLSAERRKLAVERSDM